MKKILLILSLIVATFIAWEWLRCPPGNYPKAWDKLTVGMTRREVATLVPDLSQSGMKGHFAGSRPGWILNVMFDENLKIESITKDYTCEYHGIRNRMIFISKDESYERKWRRDTPISQ